METVAEISLAALLALSSLFTTGLQALQDRKYDAAVANLTKVYAAETPGNVWRELALFFRAEAYQGKGAKEQALADLKALILLSADDKLQRQARERFKQWGGDPKELPPADSPKAVWAQLIAAGKNGKAEALRSRYTGELRQTFDAEVGDDPEALKGHVQEIEQAEVVGERVGVNEQAGRAWLLLREPRTGERVTMALVLDASGTRWLFSAVAKNVAAEVAAAAGAAQGAADKQPPAAGPEPAQAAAKHNTGDLKQLGLALLMYSGEKDGAFPPNWQALKDGQILDDGPVYRWTNPQTGEEKLPFIYRPGLKDDDPMATAKLLAASPAPTGGRREVLFVDGHVEALPEPKFQEQAKAQGWAVPKAVKKEDVPAAKQEQIRALVQKLGDASFQVRRQAKTDLKAMGPEAQPVLEEFLKATDVEVRTAVKEILDGK